MLVCYELNTVGRDFCVGDIHGCFKRLESFLTAIGFNPTKDRLFSVGDLTDRHEDSWMVLEWLEKPWFHPVKGNHDFMVIDACDPLNSTAEANLFMNGGQWFFKLDYKKQQEIAFALECLPLMIEVDTPAGKYGIVHSTVPYGDWELLKERRFEQDVQMYAVWDRNRHNEAQQLVVKGVDHVLVGHNMVPEAELLGNVLNLDTGAVQLGKYAVFPNGFTILNMTEFELYKEVDYVV